jgi:hypothetical protein
LVGEEYTFGQNESRYKINEYLRKTVFPTNKNPKPDKSQK